MSEKNIHKSNYKPQYKWGGDTNLWDKETDQMIIKNHEDNVSNKSKEELQREVNYGKRINYWH